MKTSLMIVGMMMITGMAMGQWQIPDVCEGVTCGINMAGPFSIEICYKTELGVEISFKACYCVDIINQVLKIEKLQKSGVSYGFFYESSLMLNEAIRRIFEYLTASECWFQQPCEGLLIPYYDAEVNSCWKEETIQVHEDMFYTRLIQCGTDFCVYRISGKCYYDAEAECCTVSSSYSGVMIYSCSRIECDRFGCAPNGPTMSTRCTPICPPEYGK